METTVLIVGGDMRQLYLSRLLAKEYSVYALGLHEARIASQLGFFGDEYGYVNNINSLCELSKKPDIIIFPILSSVDNEHVNMPLSELSVRIEEVLEHAKRSTLILAGKPCKTLSELCARQGLRLIDYFEREELAVLNAVPTAFVNRGKRVKGQADNDLMFQRAFFQRAVLRFCAALKSSRETIGS